MAPLKFGSINIRGLCSREKQNHIVDVLRKYSLDILAIQETKIFNPVGCSVLMQRVNRTFEVLSSWASPNNSAGVMLLVRKSTNVEIIQHSVLVRSRCLHVKAKVADKIIDFINVYCPSDARSRRAFFALLAEDTTVFGSNIILMGDFNCVEDLTVDRYGSRLGYGAAGSDALQTLLAKYDLVDTSRNHPLEFTHYSRSTAARLDRCYTSHLVSSQCTRPERHPCPHSDHWLIIVKMFPPSDGTAGSSGYWKLNTTLLNDAEWINQVKNEIQGLSNGSGHPLLEWDMFKSRVKEISIHHSKRLAANYRRQECALEKQLIEYAKRKDQGEDVWDRILNIQRLLAVHEERRMKGAAVRSRTDWIRNQERPSRRFYSLETESRNRKAIQKLSVGSQTITDPSSIKDYILRHFTNLLSEVNTSRHDFVALAKHAQKLSEEETDNLNCTFTPTEICEALKAMKSGKAPGCDGLPTEFYKKFWNELKNHIIVLFETIVKERRLPPTQRNGIITLLPKCSDPEKLQDITAWRPISLLNADYKLFAKTLANRLRNIVGSVINEAQKCAVPGRRISDLVQLYTHVYEWHKNTSTPMIMLKLDQQAAFDCVNHKYMFEVLTQMGIKGPFMDAIQASYFGICGQIQVNGRLSEEFRVERSVRQGCPLSMLLYILQLEPVLQWINKTSSIKGVALPNQLVDIKYGAYADDVVLLLSSTDSVIRVMCIWNFFEQATGSAINLRKSKGLWVGPWTNTPDRWKGLTWTTTGDKFLGVWIGTREMTQKNWENIGTKIESQLQRWRGRELTLHGRTIVWNTYILSRYRYRALVTPVPNKLRCQIDRIGAIYIWNKNYEPVRRAALFWSRQDGGLGAISLRWKIDALRLNLIEQVKHNNSPLYGLYKPWLTFTTDTQGNTICTPRPGRKPPVVGEMMSALRQHHHMINDLQEHERTPKELYRQLVRHHLPPTRVTIQMGENQVARCIKRIFRLATIPAIKDLYFRILHDCLPTGHWLEKRGLTRFVQDPRCPYCQHVETADHILLHCQQAKTIWGAFAHIAAQCPSSTTVLSRAMDTSLSPHRMVILGCILITIWRERNARIFESTSRSNTSATIARVRALLKYHWEVDTRLLGPESTLIQWQNSAAYTYIS